MSSGTATVANLAGAGSLVGPLSESGVDVEASNFLPSLALGIPIPVNIPAERDRGKQDGRLGPGSRAVVETSRMPTPTPPSASRSSSTSSSTSSSSTATADTSVTSDTNRPLDTNPSLNFNPHKDTQEEHKNENDAPASIASSPEAKPDTDGIKYLHSTHPDTTTISSTLASTTVPSVSTAVSSSSTSLPTSSFSSSSSTSTSTSTSVTNINDHPTAADPNGLLSLLRPPFRSNPNLNVKFAPLPELAPRRRKSAIPLGMAARTQLAQRRRVMYQDRYDYHGEYEDSSVRPSGRRYQQQQQQHMKPPDISEEGGAAAGAGDGSGKRKGKKKKVEGAAPAAGQQQQQQQERDGEKNKKSKEKYPVGEDIEDMPGDPFVFLAKKMGKAGKHLWKKVAHSGKDGEKGGGAGEENGQAGNAPMVVVVPAPAKGEEGPQSESKKLGDGEQNAKDPTEPEVVAPDHELPLPVTRPLSLDESPIVEGGEEAKATPKTGSTDLDEKITVSSLRIPHPIAAS